MRSISEIIAALILVAVVVMVSAVLFVYTQYATRESVTGATLVIDAYAESRKDRAMLHVFVENIGDHAAGILNIIIVPTSPVQILSVRAFNPDVNVTVLSSLPSNLSAQSTPIHVLNKYYKAEYIMEVYFSDVSTGSVFRVYVIYKDMVTGELRVRYTDVVVR
jgi:flagellin-like protein